MPKNKRKKSHIPKASENEINKDSTVDLKV